MRMSGADLEEETAVEEMLQSRLQERVLKR